MHIMPTHKIKQMQLIYKQYPINIVQHIIIFNYIID